MTESYLPCLPIPSAQIRALVIRRRVEQSPEAVGIFFHRDVIEENAGLRVAVGARNSSFLSSKRSLSVYR